LPASRSAWQRRRPHAAGSETSRRKQQRPIASSASPSNSTNSCTRSSLDVHYQLHLLEVARDLLAHNCTVIAVLHDLNVAFQYGQQLFVIHGGRLAYETSRPSDISAELIERVFRVRATRVGEDGHTTWRFMKADNGEPIPVRRSPP